MRQILITKGTIDYGLSTATGDIAGANELNLLADGSLVCLERDGTFVDDVLPNITQDSIYFAVGRTSEAPIITPLIDIATLTYIKTAYSAPAAKVMVIGSNTNAGTTYNCNLPTSPVVGSVAEIYIIDETKPHYDNSRVKKYEYQVKTGDTTASVEQAIIAKINADANAIVTATEIDSTNHDGFSLTADTAGRNFNVYCGGILANADILAYKNIIHAGTAGISAGHSGSLTTALTAHAPGIGTYAQIAATESDYSTERGNSGITTSRGVDLYSATARAVSGATYTQYLLTWTTPPDNKLMPQNNLTHTLIIAVPSGDTGAGKTIAALDAILASI